MKKKLISILAAILSMVMLASCGATSTSTSTETSGVPASTASGEKTVITYLRPGNEVEHNAELVQAINDKLDADGIGLQLEIKYISSDVFQDKVNMMLSSGEEFDLLCIMEDVKEHKE